MKKIFFIRHGESTKNTSPLRLGPEAPLTEIGKEQAQALAKRCADLGIQKIFSSPAVRTVETAQPIGDQLHLPVTLSELFQEHKKPSEVFGLRRDDPKTRHILGLTISRFYDLNYRYSDEENFLDLKKRAREALNLLNETQEDTILVVTHGIFLRVVLAYALFGEGLTARQLRQFMNFVTFNNTGLTLLEHTPAREFPWRLAVLNDIAHLG